jgi:hypothetical protein
MPAWVGIEEECRRIIGRNLVQTTVKLPSNPKATSESRHNEIFKGQIHIQHQIGQKYANHKQWQIKETLPKSEAKEKWNSGKHPCSWEIGR